MEHDRPTKKSKTLRTKTDRVTWETRCKRFERTAEKMNSSEQMTTRPHLWIMAMCECSSMRMGVLSAMMLCPAFSLKTWSLCNEVDSEAFVVYAPSWRLRDTPSIQDNKREALLNTSGFDKNDGETRSHATTMWNTRQIILTKTIATRIWDMRRRKSASWRSAWAVSVVRFGEMSDVKLFNR